LADGPAKAIQWTKMSLNRRLIQEVNLILPTSTAFEYLTMYSEDHKEATAAFLEKRKPKFSGE
jgi:enoyl-CoA hydratase